MSPAEVRRALKDFVYKDLIGPAHGPGEVIDDSPKIRYAAGVLFPQESERNESDAVGGVEGDGTNEGTEEDAIGRIPESDEQPADVPSPRLREPQYDDTVTLANTYRPSAMGISFVVAPSASAIVVEPRAALYDSEQVVRPNEHSATSNTNSSAPEMARGEAVFSTIWRRRPLDLGAQRIPIPSTAGAPSRIPLAHGLSLCVVARVLADARRLVTISLFNTTFERRRDAEVFFQCGFDITTDGGAHFLEYRLVDDLRDDPEELSLEMLYTSRQVFAIGHGCAAEWSEPRDGLVARLGTSIMPSVVVPPVIPLAMREPALDMAFLAGGCETPAEQIPEVLEQLAAKYEGWIHQRTLETANLEPRFQNVAQEHLNLCRAALRRIRAGIALLADERQFLRAFMLVNRVMLMQQHHSRLRRKLSDPWAPLPAPNAYGSDWEARTGYWRAFQMAFILMTLPGLVPGDRSTEIDGTSVPERDLVDLIWFPTGGGKTEAYLGVTAFLVFASRLLDRNRSGCQVLMRYTLRLLTSQQFQRAASLICACELVRREDPRTFGDNPITIGLWVGMSLTPNTEKDALRALGKFERQGDKNPFQLLSCPWCGTELDNREDPGYRERGGRLVFVCPAKDCPFASLASHLPVCIVDDSIYQSPPTLLIGTVDKFAMLAWRSSAGAIFEVGGGPDLIIQDELHLISGPLGSMVGLYESVIDYLCSRNGRRPKIVASTATIRRAGDQCKALYDRPMFQFPPPGLSASDSFFAAEDAASPGQLYVGFLPSAASSPLTAQIRSVVALQQGALLVAPGEAPNAIDPYWTLVQYFGSLKELGRAATFITADIPEFEPTMHRRYDLKGGSRRFMHSSMTEELTSRQNEDEIPKILKRLEQTYAPGADFAMQALDTVLATNMISVGVDVARLGLMMIVTQPKGTSEYIQASSRVGRRHAGLVFTLYNAGRPRDRSHYEQFTGYHGAFYRFVEPTSVTPFSPPALRRALHAILIIAGRHVARWLKPDVFDRDDPAFCHFIEFLRARARSVDPDHVREFEDTLSERLTDWEERLPRVWGDLGGARTEPALMRTAGTTETDEDPDSWETPTSLRNVDVECRAEVIPRYVVAGSGA